MSKFAERTRLNLSEVNHEELERWDRDDLFQRLVYLLRGSSIG